MTKPSANSKIMSAYRITTRAKIGRSPSCRKLHFVHFGARGDGGKLPCLEVDLYDRTSSPFEPFVLITAKCRRRILCSWLTAPGPGGSRPRYRGWVRPGRVESWRDTAPVDLEAALHTDFHRSVPGVASRSATHGARRHTDFVSA